MTDLSYSDLPVANDTNNASDVTTPLNEVKSYVNGAGWVDTTRLADDSVTAAKLDLFPACSIYNSSALSVTTGVALVLTFNSEYFDTASMHSTSSNTDRLVFPEAGIYRVSLSVSWDTASAGVRQAYLYGSSGVTGTLPSADDKPSHSGAAFSQTTTGLLSASAGGYVRFAAYQDSGGTVTATPSVSAEFVGRAS